MTRWIYTCRSVEKKLITIGILLVPPCYAQISLSYRAHLGILKSALMGFSPNRGGVLSATSMAVMPNDHTSDLAS